MVKSTKAPPPRKPVKARGALQTPKSTPQRGHQRWYSQPGWQLVAMAVAIAVIGGTWAGGGAWLDARKENRVHRSAVARFDRSYSALRSPVVDVLSAMATKTGELASGTVSGADFETQAKPWLAELRKMDAGLRRRTIPPELRELEESRAVLVQGYLVYIDAVKVYSVAASSPDPGLKDAAIKQGNNLAAHAGSIVQTGEAMLQSLKTRFDLGEPPAQPEGSGAAEQPIKLPPEEASGGPGGQTGGQGGAIPGSPPDAGGAAGDPPGSGAVPVEPPPAAP